MYVSSLSSLCARSNTVEYEAQWRDKCKALSNLVTTQQSASRRRIVENVGKLTRIRVVKQTETALVPAFVFVR